MSQKATNSETIANIFNSRKIILDLAQRRGYNIEEYQNFSINVCVHTAVVCVQLYTQLSLQL